MRCRQKYVVVCLLHGDVAVGGVVAGDGAPMRVRLSYDGDILPDALHTGADLGQVPLGVLEGPGRRLGGASVVCQGACG